MIHFSISDLIHLRAIHSVLSIHVNHNVFYISLLSFFQFEQDLPEDVSEMDEDEDDDTISRKSEETQYFESFLQMKAGKMKMIVMVLAMVVLILEVGMMKMMVVVVVMMMMMVVVVVMMMMVV